MRGPFLLHLYAPPPTQHSSGNGIGSRHAFSASTWPCKVPPHGAKHTLCSAMLPRNPLTVPRTAPGPPFGRGMGAS